jgi:TonB-linked SusC/RagA family outer membrane protein
MKKKWFFKDFRYLFAWVEKFLKVMKLCVFLIALTSFQAFAINSYAQSKKIDLKISEQSISEILQEIENQSEFYFFYNNKVALEQKVSIDVKDKTITELLDVLFSKTNTEYTINNRQIILSGKESGTNQQQNNANGKVTDSSGAPLPGVIVSLKGTKTVTVTDSDGNYSLNGIPSDATLVFSFIGLKTKEVNVSGKSSVDVTMEDEAVGLDEVVVIGYGTVKKQNLTGSVASIKNEALTQRSINSVGEAFAGQLAGVQAQQTSGKPGSELTIKIRGLSTINASNDPLYVIDGVPSGTNMKDINPNDIASIEVLKDAASTAIYGARGSNGVVLITTKQGGKSKPTFDFVANYGVQQVDKIIDMMDINEWAAYQVWYKNEAYVRSGGNLSTPVASRPSSNQYPDSFLHPETLPNVNWQKEIYQIAPTQNYQLTATGGSDLGSYLISGSYMNQKGVVKETAYKRINFRVNTTLNVGKNLKLGMNIAPSFSTENNPDSEGKESALHHAIQYSPNTPTNSNTEEWGYTAYGTSGWANPLERLKEVHDETRTNKILSTVWGELEVIKNLKFKSQYGYNYQEGRNSYFRPSNVNTGIASYGTSSSNDIYSWSFQNTLNYNPKVSNWFDMNVLLGESIEGSKYYYSSNKANGYSNSLVYTLNVASTAVTASTSEYESALSSYFGRASFNAKDKYLLTANLRYDGSSNFGKNTKWGWFPSASLGWKIDREDFMESTKNWLDLLKLRVSVGKTGNNSIGYYSSISLLGVTNYNLNGTVVSGLSPDSYGNPDLGWESKLSKDLGIDFGLFKGRVQANIDFYINDTEDMLQDVPVSYMTGYSTMTQNIGKVRNKGWEFEVTSHNIDRQFKWTTSFNISRNVNEVKELGNNNASIITASWGKTAFITKVGEAISSYYMYKTDGILTDADFNSNGEATVPVASGQEKGNIKIVDVSKDGKIDANDMTIIGSNQPDFFWGMSNKFSYKNFDLTVLLQGSQGGKVFLLGTRHMDVGASGTNQFSRWVTCYKPDRNPSTLPTGSTVNMEWDGKTPYPFGNNPSYNDTWLYDASFVRIKSVTLGYNLPKALCSKIHAAGCRFYLTGDNLFTWNHYPGATPETNSYGNSTGETNTYQGMDYATYPMSRRTTFGINLTF